MSESKPIESAPIIVFIPHDRRVLLRIKKSSAAYSDDESITPMLLLETQMHKMAKNEEDIPSEDELEKIEEHLVAIGLSDAVHLHRTIGKLLTLANERGLLEEDKDGKLRVKKK